MPRKEFEAFTRLDASDVNDFLMDQTVQTFAGTAARGSAIGTATEGMVTYLNDIDSLSVYNGTTFTTDRTIQVFAGTAARGSAIGTAVEGMYTHINETDSLEFYNGTAWVTAGGASGILQVVSVPKTDTFTLTSTTMTDITGLSASITPSSTSSKVFVVLTFGQIDGNTDVIISGDVTRNGTAIGIGDAAGTRTRAGWSVITSAGNRSHSASFTFLDSPATTSSVTYQARVRSRDESLYINRSSGDTDGILARTISTITLMEVAG